jgi:hypothetical protein
VIEEPDRPPRIVEYESRFRHTHRFELELLFRCAGLRVIESWSDFIPYKGLAEQPALDNVENDFVYLLARA